MPQRPYKCLIVSPAPRRCEVDFLPNLPFAGGGSDAIGAMKIQTRRIPGQAQEVDDPSGLAVQIGDQVLVLHLEYLQGQRLQPVRDKPISLDVMKAALSEIERE